MASNNRTQETSMEIEENIKFYSLQFPPVLETVFKFLPAGDLSICAEVCRSWNAIATTMKHKRRNMCLLSMDRHPNENVLNEDLKNAILSQWSEFNVVITFGLIEKYDEMEMVFYLLSQIAQRISEINNYKISSRHGILKNLISNTRALNNMLKRCLKEDYSIAHVTTPAWICHDNSLSHPTTILLISSAAGLEVQPFPLSFERETALEEREGIKQLFMNNRTNTLQTTIKLMLIFSNAIDDEDVDITDRRNYESSVVAKYLSEDTIIIGHNDEKTHFGTGIAFAGNDIRVHCIALDNRICCMKYCFSNLKTLFSKEEVGFAFIIQKVDLLSPLAIPIVWGEYFKNVAPLVIIGDSISSFIPNTNKRHETCNECHTNFDTKDSHNKDLIIVFILNKNFVFKSINN